MASKVKYRTRTIVKRAAHRAKKTTIPLAVVAGFGPLIADTITVAKQNGVAQIPHALAWHLAGVNTWDNNRFDFNRLVMGWTPILAGIVVHKFANKLGVNRAIANMGIPLLRI